MQATPASYLVLELDEAGVSLWRYHCWDQESRRGVFMERDGGGLAGGGGRRRGYSPQDHMGKVTVLAASVQAPAESSWYSENTRKIFFFLKL